jgi:hypothetical protein
MADNKYFRKRPCRICRTWFQPNPRVGDRQKTCGSEECKSKWHAKKCADWNGRNRPYFQNIYLNKKLQAIASKEVNPENPLPPVSKYNKFPQLPQEVIQGVMGHQQFIIIEYLSRLLLGRIQDVMCQQRYEIAKKTKRLPGIACLSGDSRERPP